MTAGAWTLIVLLSFLWGGAFFLTEFLVPHLGAGTIAFGRVAIAALGFWALAIIRGKAPEMSIAHWRDYLIGGLVTFAIPFGCLAWAQGQLTGGLTAIINAMTPIMVVLVSHFYPGGERATVLKATGVAVAFLGVAALIVPNAQDGFGGPLIAQFVALIAPVSYAIAGNFSRRFADQDPTITITGTMTGAALWTLPLALLLEDLPSSLPIDAVIAFLAIGLISTGFAFRLFYVLLPRVGATNFSIVTFLVPISAIALGVAFLGERLETLQIIGMAIIFAGLILVDGRLVRRLRNARSAAQA